MADDATPDGATDVRTRLREVALDLFGRQGVRDTSTREILAAAGLKNPSAISYHFGSKAELVDDLVSELIGGTAPVLQRQIELARTGPPSVEAWAGVAVDSAVDLVATERGCLLARLWWEYDGHLRPEVLEQFLGSDNRIATEWIDAASATLPALPRFIAVARNITMFRTLEWMIARRAGRILTGTPAPALVIQTPDALRTLLLEVAIGILAQPTTLTAADITFNE
jgi:AcrR family transcriptional regulator